ncbi:MAG: cyclic nucleotide-binding domain-containing protein [Myxococcota bacterium]
MSIRVKVASSPAEIRALLEVRHRVFVDEEGYMPSQGGAIVDLFDALPTTRNLLAVSAGEVCGGLRVTLDSEAGMPADRFFDYRAILPEGARPASASMLCLRKSVRGPRRLISGMLQMCVYWAHARGLTHLCCPINPRVAPLMKPIGLEPVGDEFVDAKGLPTLPMVLDMSNLGPRYADFVHRQDVGLWLDSFERAFFQAGEAIVREGEPGREAFLVVDGAAAALAAGTGENGPVVQGFAPGQVFGELALLTDLPRSTTVVATEPTDLMVISRDNFERQVSTNPDLALSMMSSIGERFYQAVTASGAPSEADEASAEYSGAEA